MLLLLKQNPHELAELQHHSILRRFMQAERFHLSLFRQSTSLFLAQLRVDVYDNIYKLHIHKKVYTLIEYILSLLICKIQHLLYRQY